jgi:hypothetical protein
MTPGVSAAPLYTVGSTTQTHSDHEQVSDWTAGPTGPHIIHTMVWLYPCVTCRALAGKVELPPQEEMLGQAQAEYQAKRAAGVPNRWAAGSCHGVQSILSRQLCVLAMCFCTMPAGMSPWGVLKSAIMATIVPLLAPLCLQAHAYAGQHAVPLQRPAVTADGRAPAAQLAPGDVHAHKWVPVCLVCIKLSWQLCLVGSCLAWSDTTCMTHMSLSLWLMARSRPGVLGDQ